MVVTNALAIRSLKIAVKTLKWPLEIIWETSYYDCRIAISWLTKNLSQLSKSLSRVSKNSELAQ